MSPVRAWPFQRGSFRIHQMRGHGARWPGSVEHLKVSKAAAGPRSARPFELGGRDQKIGVTKLAFEHLGTPRGRAELSCAAFEKGRPESAVLGPGPSPAHRFSTASLMYTARPHISIRRSNCRPARLKRAPIAN
jgi:hypothetical protein